MPSKYQFVSYWYALLAILQTPCSSSFKWVDNRAYGMKYVNGTNLVVSIRNRFVLSPKLSGFDGYKSTTK